MSHPQRVMFILASAASLRAPTCPISGTPLGYPLFSSSHSVLPGKTIKSNHSIIKKPVSLQAIFLLPRFAFSEERTLLHLKDKISLVEFQAFWTSFWSHKPLREGLWHSDISPAFSMCQTIGEFFFFNWGMVDLQSCVNFCSVAKWFSYTYTNILFYVIFHYSLSQIIDYSSLCYVVGSYCLSVLYEFASTNPIGYLFKSLIAFVMINVMMIMLIKI